MDSLGRSGQALATTAQGDETGGFVTTTGSCAAGRHYSEAAARVVLSALMDFLLFYYKELKEGFESKINNAGET